MKLHPVIAALRKHKAGVVLIALQIALTLAVVCNASFIIGQRIQRVNRSVGLDEQNMFLVTQQWVDAPTGDDANSIRKLDAMQREDLAALRALPDVESVSPVNALPLFGLSWVGSVSLTPHSSMMGSNARSIFYFGDENFVPTLGLHVIAGRNFNASDVGNKGSSDHTQASTAMVNKTLADLLFPKGNAIGKIVYLNGRSTPSTIVGVIENLQTTSTDSWVGSFEGYSVLEPMRINSNLSHYAVRAKPGRLLAAMRATASALYKVDPLRVLDDDSVKSYADIRDEAHRADVGMAILMSVICVILLGVTAAGIVGLTSFWVGQRHRQMGMRRALGARKVDILRYFQLENLLISGAGALIGVALATGLNLLLMKHYQMDRMPVLYVLVGVVVVLLLGQSAVFAPARRASNVPPAEATRNL
ncbi:ABC transporter permease [Dyella psychrodurans]|uniref:Peptide ABC transporter permease n=1 Tax=Dyella psychrodurans TaxID=1927960 RepID=A0A370WUT9_9GAMM|nr:ABC transporter permease [Dyella psychrodurans]RDS79796.1 peptide ABC transporter permease [Dyella psychrodurans]